MKNLFIFSFLLVSLNSVSQSIGEGTLIIATITRNEIIMAADSRNSFFETDDRTKSPIAYFDNSCKLFRLKQFVIGVSGASAIGYTLYSTIISEYNKTAFRDSSAYLTLKNFIQYLDRRFPTTSSPDKKTNVFLIGGYVNGLPQIAGYSYKTGEYNILKTGTLFTDTLVEKYAIKQLNIKTTVYKQIEQTIYDYAAGENKTNTIGGPISIIRIFGNNTISYFQNDFSNNIYTSLLDMFNAIKEDRLKGTYLVPNGKERLLRIFRH